MKALRSVVVDSQLATITALLSVFGLAMVYSAGQTDIKTAAASAYKSQAMWLLIGVVSTYGLLKMPVRFIRWATWPAYLFTLALLLSLLVLGVGSGAHILVHGLLEVVREDAETEREHTSPPA